MNLEYTYSESTIKPQEIEAGKTTVYFRKDIDAEERTYDDHTYTFYTYQEARMPIEEFRKMAEIQASVNAVKGVNDSENISQIVENGSDSTNNQLILMEAIADLYDIIATMV